VFQNPEEHLPQRLGTIRRAGLAVASAHGGPEESDKSRGIARICKPPVSQTTRDGGGESPALNASCVEQHVKRIAKAAQRALAIPVKRAKSVNGLKLVLKLLSQPVRQGRFAQACFSLDGNENPTPTNQRSLGRIKEPRSVRFTPYNTEGR
jgi:hypothetical protein